MHFESPLLASLLSFHYHIPSFSLFSLPLPLSYRQFVAGLIKYTPETMVFLAPTINSYKRFANQSWAPTRLAWALDNRTAGTRLWLYVFFFQANLISFI